MSVKAAFLVLFFGDRPFLLAAHVIMNLGFNMPKFPQFGSQAEND